MISFAKKILVNGRAAAAQPLDGDAEVRTYSLTSTHEPPSQISGTSFALNPEHTFATTHPFSWNDTANTNSQEDAILKLEGVTSNPDVIDGVGDATEMIMCPGAADPDTLERSNHVEVTFGQPSRSVCCTTEMHSEEKDLGYGSSTNRSNENLTHVVSATGISPSEAEHRSLNQESDNHSWYRVPSSNTEQWLSSDEKISESQLQKETSRRSSLCSVSDDVLDSVATVSDAPDISASSLNVLDTSARFQRAKKKQRPRELKPRRKTLEIFYFGGKSSDAAASRRSWSQSKSLNPSPTHLEPSCADLRPRRSTPMSRIRRHTVDGLGGELDAPAGPEDQILPVPPSFWNVLWPEVYSPSDERVSDVPKGYQRGKVATMEGARRAPGFRRSSLCATAICVSDMMRYHVITDLDLLEEDTEFEPCAVTFENTVVLWPAAVDKPSCFQSSRCLRSWITSLEASGFVGSECIRIAPVTLSQSLLEHSQLLFLFPRHLIFAEQKSHSLLKVDQKVAAGDIWLSTRKEDMLEVLEMDSAFDGSRSCVLGWPPTTNAVVTFSTIEERALWVAKIEELIEAENADDKDPNQQLAIKIVHKEIGHTRTREVTVAKLENSSQVLLRCLQEFHLGVSSSRDFQLSVRCGRDQLLQPLVGHESPFLIESWFRNFASRKDGSHGNCFVLRERKRAKSAPRDAVGYRRTSKAPLRTLFKRSLPRSARSSPLFGSSLSGICVDNAIPVRIQALFRYLYEHAPSTDGVFRKPGGHKEVSDFKSQLNSGDEVNFEGVSIHVVASVVKEWLRNLPDCLLTCDLYQQWIDVSNISDVALVHEELRRLSSSLPASHLLVLHHLMCVLHRIQLHSKQNRMTPFNLAVCIGPNILHPHPSASIDLQLTSVEIANAIVRMLIEAIEPVLGSDCIELYRDIADPYLIQEFEVDGNYEFNQALSTDHSTNLPTSNSLESLDSFQDNPLVAELGQPIESVTPVPALAASNPQLYEGHPSISVTQTNGRHSERVHQQHDWKSEPSDVSESQRAFDSDTGSLSSPASERSAGAPVPLRMRGGMNVRKCLQRRIRASRSNTEELTSSFEDRFSFSDDQSNSVLDAEEASSEGEKPASAIIVERNEARPLSVDKDVVSAALDDIEIEEGEKNYLNGNTEPTARETGEHNTGKIGFTKKDETEKLLSEAHVKKLAVGQFRPSPMEIGSLQKVSTDNGATFGGTEAGPTKRGAVSSSVVRNWIEKMEERQSENTSKHPITSFTNQKAEFENRQVAASLKPEAVAHKPEKAKLEDLPRVSSKVEQSGNIRRSSEEPEPSRVRLEMHEENPSVEDLSPTQKKPLVVSRKNRVKERVPIPFRAADLDENHSRDSGKCSHRTESCESIAVSKQIDCRPVSGKANRQIDSGKFNNQTDSPEPGKVNEIDSPDSRRAHERINRDESACFVSVQGSSKSKITNGKLQDDKELWARGQSGDQEKRPDPSRSVKIAVDESTIFTRSYDKGRDDRRRVACGNVGRSRRITETEWRDMDHKSEDQPKDIRLKVQPTERRLRDRSRDSGVKDSRLNVRPKDSDDKWRLEHIVDEETEWKDSHRDYYRLKDQPRDNRPKDQSRGRRLIDQSRDNRLKDQPRKSRLKVQPRAFGDNWRLENDSETFERVTSAKVVTSVYPRNITSEGCRATLRTPQYLPQNREPQQSGQPAYSTNQFGAQRSVTVIQLCNNDSVILQKNLKMT